MKYFENKEAREKGNLMKVTDLFTVVTSRPKLLAKVSHTIELILEQTMRQIDQILIASNALKTLGVKARVFQRLHCYLFAIVASNALVIELYHRLNEKRAHIDSFRTSTTFLVIFIRQMDNFRI